MFGRKKKLFEEDPKALNIEMLSVLQGSLVAKLILVNDELIRRYRVVADAVDDMPNTQEHRDALTASAKHLDQVNEILKTELARITRRPATATTGAGSPAG